VAVGYALQRTRPMLLDYFVFFGLNRDNIASYPLNKKKSDGFDLLFVLSLFLLPVKKNQVDVCVLHQDNNL
jgi:hypothetical protein